MSPGPMPLEVVRRGGVTDGSTVRSVGWVSAMEVRLCGGSDGLPDPGVEVDVFVSVRADADDRRAVGGEGAVEAGAEGIDVGGSFPAAAVQRGCMGEVEAVRGGDVLDERVALGCGRKEVEDPAAVVVEEHDDQPKSEPGGGQQASDVVGQGDVAD